MSDKIKVGDWVNSYAKGIYRIEKIVDRYYDESSVLGDNKIGDAYKDRIVICKRLLNSKYKKSIGDDSCSEYYITPLSNEQRQNLDKAINENPKLLVDLDNYQIPTPTSIYNSDLQIDNDEDLKSVEALVMFVKNGKTFIEIQNEMKRLDILRLKPEYFGNYGFQLFNYDNEYLNKRQVYRDAKLYKK